MSVRAKCVVYALEDAADGAKNVCLRPVYGEGAPENSTYWQYTPSGDIRLSMLNEGAWSQFIEGADYYVDFTPATGAAPAVSAPRALTQVIEDLIGSVRGAEGRAPTRELSLAVTKLQEALFWVKEHQTTAV